MYWSEIAKYLQDLKREKGEKIKSDLIKYRLSVMEKQSN